MNVNHSKKNKITNYLWAAFFLAPLILGLSIFYVYPFFKNIFNSFTSLGAFGQWEWVGLDNFKRLAKDQDVWSGFKNTLTYTIITVPLIVFLSMFIAQLLNTKVKMTTFYRVLYFLPTVTMPAAIAMIWKWIYNGEFGIFNHILSYFGIDNIYWISDPKFGMMALIIVGVWSGLGMNIIYFLGGLQTIPQSYYEAVEIDGASPLQKFRHITIPLLSPTIFFVTITQFIGTFQIFDLIFMLISRSSRAIDSTKSIVYLFYQYAFEFMEKGYASAISMVIFLAILLVTVVQLWGQKKWVHYQ